MARRPSPLPFRRVSGLGVATVAAGHPQRARPRERGETTVDLWTEAFEEMNAIDPKQLNLEQRLRRAEVKALLVIAQELVALRESGTGGAG